MRASNAEYSRVKGESARGVTQELEGAAQAGPHLSQTAPVVEPNDEDHDPWQTSSSLCLAIFTRWRSQRSQPT